MERFSHRQEGGSWQHLGLTLSLCQAASGTQLPKKQISWTPCLQYCPGASLEYKSEMPDTSLPSSPVHQPPPREWSGASALRGPRTSEPGRSSETTELNFFTPRTGETEAQGKRYLIMKPKTSRVLVCFLGPKMPQSPHKGWKRCYPRVLQGKLYRFHILPHSGPL